MALINQKPASIVRAFNAAVVCVVVTGLAVFAFIIGAYNYELSMAELQKKASNTTDLASLSVIEPVWNYDHAALNGIANAILLDSDVMAIRIVKFGDEMTVTERVRPEAKAATFDDLASKDNYIFSSAKVLRGVEHIATVHLATSTDKVVGFIRSTSLMIAILTVILVLLISALILYLGRRMIREPIYHLHQGANQLASGNLSYVINTSRNDEFGRLAQNFDKMRNSIRMMMQEQARSEQAAAQAQIQQLQHESLQAQTKHAQEQLIQFEKMASLGQLIASVTHEINTPIGAIKSSGSSMSEALQDVVNQLPPLLQRLDRDSSLLLVELLNQANTPKTPMSSREERAVVKSLTEQLNALNVEQARQKAVLLVNLNAQSLVQKYLPLLQHADSAQIMEAVQNLSMVMASANNINVAVDRVAKIVLALKSYAHFNQAQHKTEANLVDGLETVLTLYQGQTKVGVEIVRDYENIPPIMCLADELNQVWTNLIHNALHAMNFEGVLTIGVHKVGNEAVVSVRDNGCGIPDDIRSKIFDVFFTTKPAGVGSGLGLDIVKKILQKHHARIDVQSEVGAGSVFSVYLPYSHEAAH
jgi:signal transduction histidine kinase